MPQAKRLFGLEPGGRPVGTMKNPGGRGIKPMPGRLLQDWRGALWLPVPQHFALTFQAEITRRAGVI